MEEQATLERLECSRPGCVILRGTLMNWSISGAGWPCHLKSALKYFSAPHPEGNKVREEGY